MRTDLVLDALEQVLCCRTPTQGVVYHGDRGNQYLSLRYTEHLAEAGAMASVGTVSGTVTPSLPISLRLWLDFARSAVFVVVTY